MASPYRGRACGPSPVEQPGLLGAGQSFPELLFLRGVGGDEELLPGELPLLPASGGHSLAVNHGAQIGVDAESTNTAKPFHFCAFFCSH